MITLQTKGLSWSTRLLSIALIFFIVIISNFSIAQATQVNGPSGQPLYQSNVGSSDQVFIPIIFRIPRIVPTVNIPYFEGSGVNYHQAAVTWFGQVRGNENYADMRVGYNDNEIYVRVSIFDRFLWYDQSPDIYNLSEWDAVTLYLDLQGNDGNELGSSMFSFTRQLQWWDDQLNRQIAYQGNSSGWNPVPVEFSTSYGWRGNAPNDSAEDRGHVITFHIPFESLGLVGAPPIGTKWGAGVTVHDRDDVDGFTNSEKHWTQYFDPARSYTWGQFSFGLPAYTPPPGNNVQSFTIRNGLNGVQVFDGVVGGNTLCGQGLDFWWQWGDYTYPDTGNMNVQNQGNIDDWPCYSKFYLTFPLYTLPYGQVVTSATLTLHQSGQSTGFPNDPPEALNSLVQVSVIDGYWDEGMLTWNNSPRPIENVSQAWVGFITMQDLGKATTWDLTQTVSSAYQDGRPLRIVVYSADTYGPNGKYFFTSDQEWQIMRPSLTVELGTP